ncbi:hypothetical protein BJ944DRAFT_272248 [Cunninghamella echinulata]|nr:hypothetical protein BJ944DRAFT_272248 [Cunninghamella echinulata]
MSPPPSATFQQPIKTTAHKRKRSYHKQERRYSCPSFDNLTKKKGLNGLEDEFAYTQENLATVNIMFDSLKQAFIDCEPQLKPNITRLDDMEKELLSAYDDLELQVIHLERHINKLESSWQQWKSSQNLEQQFPSPSTSTSSLS